MMPPVNYFMPNMPYHKVIFLRIEEFEAFRLVDYLGLNQHDAASRMGVSQKTLCNEIKAKF